MNPIIITPDDPIVCIDEPCPTVPEPGSGVLLALGCLLAFFLRRQS